MSAKQLFGSFIGLVALTFIGGIVKHFLSGFPVVEVFGPIWTGFGIIATTKTINDTKKMKYCGEDEEPKP